MRRTALALAVVLAAVPVSAKTLVFCAEGNPEGLNPQIVSTTTAMNAARPLFNTLVEFEPGTTRIVPGLAESWAVSEDRRDYTFKLRSGVAFHGNAAFRPTRPLNADDVLFSILRQWKPDHPYHQVSGARYDYFQDLGMPDLLQNVEKLDERTVRIRLARPDATFLGNLAMPFSVVQSAEYADVLLREGRPEQFDRDPIGTGPFAFAGFQRGVAVRYRAFSDYWRGRQPIDTLVFSITPNPAVRLTKLKAGECHIMAYPNPADLKRIAEDSALVLMGQAELNIGYLAMNTTRPPFDDLRVRRAVNMAIDKSAIIDAVYEGAGVVAKNPIPPTLWSHNDEVRDYPYDPPGARRLLAEAGFPEGFSTELWYLPVSRPYNPNGKRVAEMIQFDLAKIGVRLVLKTEDWSDYRTRLQSGETAMALYGWTGDNGDPDNFLDALLGCTSARKGGNNIAKWCQAEYDGLVSRAKQASSQAEREQLYRSAQEIAKREAPWVPLAHSVVFVAARKEVTGFRMDPLGRHLFEGVSLE
jgi:dipeptide transport system substrate-binding protein